MKFKLILKRVCFVLLFIILLPIFIVSGIIKLVIKFGKYKKWNTEKYSISKFLEDSCIEKIDIMEGYAFENYLKFLFYYLGYEVAQTPERKDFGADLILKKEGICIAVQAKRYRNLVGIKSVQEIIGAKIHYNADELMVVTNNKFSSEAEQIAKEQNVRLVDREELIELINEAKENLNAKEISNKIVEEDLYKFRI